MVTRGFTGRQPPRIQAGGRRPSPASFLNAGVGPAGAAPLIRSFPR
jgi:hypothetical protein